MNKTLLSENMLRFGTKNLSDSQQKQLIVKSIMETINQNGLSYEIRKQLREQNLLSEATLKDLDSANMATVQKFFAAEWKKYTNGPQMSTANLVYVAQTTDMEKAMKYFIKIFKMINVNFGVINFPITAFYGFVDYFPNTGLSDSGDLQLGIDPSGASEKTVKDAASTINFYYEEILPETITTHFNGQKAKLATAIASAKSSANFAALGPMLTGAAKTVYDLIAAS
jgi:hypothetical protein